MCLFFCVKFMYHSACGRINYMYLQLTSINHQQWQMSRFSFWTETSRGIRYLFSNLSNKTEENWNPKVNIRRLKFVWHRKCKWPNNDDFLRQLEKETDAAILNAFNWNDTGSRNDTGFNQFFLHVYRKIDWHGIVSYRFDHW